MHYIKPLANHITELQQDLIEGPLIKDEPGTWISKLVITDELVDKRRPKRRGETTEIRANLDCCPLNEVLYQTQEPIPTVEDL